VRDSSRPEKGGGPVTYLDPKVRFKQATRKVSLRAFRVCIKIGRAYLVRRDESVVPLI
jgi:hypothetical protein